LLADAEDLLRSDSDFKEALESTIEVLAHGDDMDREARGLPPRQKYRKDVQPFLDQLSRDLGNGG